MRLSKLVMHYAIFLILVLLTSTAHSADKIAQYTFDETDWPLTTLVPDVIAGHNGQLNGAVSRTRSDSATAHINTCASAMLGGGTIDISGLPVSTTTGDKTSVSFWMNWSGNNSVMPIGWQVHDLWFTGGHFGFNTGGSDIYGISSSGLANSWHHVVAIFTNNQVTSNELYIDGVKQTLTHRQGTIRNQYGVVQSDFRIGGWLTNNNYAFSGHIDEVNIYNGALNQTEVNADLNYVHTAACPPDPAVQEEQLIANYTFNDNWSTSQPLSDSEGTTEGIITGQINRILSPANGNKPETCAAGEFSGGAIDINSLPVSTTAGDKTSISFWMYWNGSNNVMPLGWKIHDLWLTSGHFGFNTGGGDIYGTSSTGLANSWHHIAAVFTNNSVIDNKLYIDGVQQTLTHRRGTIVNSRAVVDPHLRLSGWWLNNGYRFRGQLDELKIYTGEINPITVNANMTSPSPCLIPLAQWHMDESTWSGSSNQLIDTSTNGHAGTAINGAQTSQLDPAIPNTPGSCGFGQFDGINDYVALPDFPNLTGSFTITAWIKSDAQHYGRIFVDDDNNSGGYALSMSDDNHQGILRFYSRQVSPVSLDTTQVITDPNKWYFVTAVHDLATQQRFIYVNGVLKANDTYNGTWGTDSGTASIGSETNASIEGVGFAPFHGNIDEVQVFQSALSVEQIRTIMAETQPCSIYTKVENFNCIVSGSDPFSGQLLTKLTDQNFTVDIAALENSTTLASHFSDTVTVELVDASQGNSCATYPVLNPEISHSLSFNVNDNAIKTSEPMSSSHAYRNLKCRVTDNMTTTPIVGCSGDSFAIRPQNFTMTSPLNNTNNSASPSSKTGTHFSITAASNSVNYDGIPAINASLITAHPGAIKIGILTGEFPAADPTTGTTTGTHFNYSEVGNFTIKNETIVDNGYTAVDQSGDCIANSSTNTENSDGKIGCNIANTPNNDIIIGRFIPDHFTLTSSAITPACNDFSYMDQLFGISYSLEARNSNNISTKNYNYSATSGQNYVKTTAVTITAEYIAPLATTSSNLTSRLSMLYDPTNWSKGRYVITHGNALFSRLNNTVDGAYDNLDIGLKVIDSDGVVLGSPDMLSSDNTNANCTASTCLENKLGQTDIRYGRFIIGNAHGSELLPLNVPFSTEFYTGLAWQVNTADSCTTVSTANNFTYTANGITLVPNLLPASASQRLSNGLSSLAFGIAGEDNTGNIDITGSLTALPWLQFDWNGDGSYDNNPLGRATFGIFKGNDKIIFRREVY